MNGEPAEMEFFKQVFSGAWITQGLAAVSELRIADELADGPQTATALAKRTGAHEDALFRLMRALASVGVFSQDGDDHFGLTPLSTLLCSDVPGSQRAFSAMMGAEFCQAWGELLHSVKTGEAGFRKRYGMSFFDYMTRHPARHAIYDEAMHGIHGQETMPMIEAYDFSGFRRVADIGGGNGQTLAALLAHYPALEGILFDLPAVAARAHGILGAPALKDRCQIEGGDFFSSVPDGADAYVLRHIIHDWQDAEAVIILRNCCKAMSSNGRVLVVENVIPPGDAPGFGKWLDIMMLMVEGRERTEDEYRRLFADAGLTLNRVTPTAAGVSILEGRAAS